MATPAVCTKCGYNEESMGFELDPKKAEANFAKHGVRFSEFLPVFEDDYALTVADETFDPREERLVSIGMGAKRLVLVVVYI